MKREREEYDVRRELGTLFLPLCCYMDGIDDMGNVDIHLER